MWELTAQIITNLNLKMLSGSLFLHNLTSVPVIDIGEGEYVRYMKLGLSCSADADAGAGAGVTIAAHKEPIYIYAQTDLSGSMSDKCKDGRSKMQHVIHIWTNIIRYFAEHSELNVHLQMSGFDNEIHRIFELTRVTLANRDALIRAVEAMHPMKTTNIHLALLDLRQSYMGVYGDDEDGGWDGDNMDVSVDFVSDSETGVFGGADASACVSSPKKFLLMMTDGDATDGIMDPVRLAQILPLGSKAAFIGFGTDHNAEMLNELGMSGVNTSNWLVNDIEYSSDVYAEIIAKWTNELFDEVVLRIENGHFYNWKTSDWVAELDLGSMSAQEKKDIHIKTLTPYDVVVHICAKSRNVTTDKVVFDREKGLVADLTQDMFRLSVQKIMHEVKEFSRENRADRGVGVGPRSPLYRMPTSQLTLDSQWSCSDSEDEDSKPVSASATETAFTLRKRKMDEYKARLRKLLKDMQAYLKPENRDFMETLINDIKVTISQFGKPTQYMYISARSASQGRQQTQNIADDSDWRDVGADADADDDTVLPVFSFPDTKRINTAYTSPIVMGVMRDISTRSVDTSSVNTRSVNTSSVNTNA